ncbi:MAG: hypothetical protein WBC70_16690 [Candidatus Aminicenantales bacterium]
MGSELEFHGISGNIEISILVLLDGIKFPAPPENRLLDEGPERVMEAGNVAAFIVKDIKKSLGFLARLDGKFGVDVDDNTP